MREGPWRFCGVVLTRAIVFLSFCARGALVTCPLLVGDFSSTQPIHAANVASTVVSLGEALGVLRILPEERDSSPTGMSC